MKRLKITNDHGWTPRTLRKQERKIKIERLWKWLKDEVIANVFHKDQNDIAQSITRFEQYVLQHPDEVLRRMGCAV
ncbi:MULTISPECIES: hypothetical protein [Anoxybacillus]|uniref:hypothetical protein n=1 Tax=Anoxybacillus TaxID=150247 RepID=UPI0002A6FEF2|nr:hypothetical protein [Anoxybacillus flavithermus]ELK23088.1 integrase catalytic region [Anoxybacillus flavithermus TNO-09.006]